MISPLASTLFNSAANPSLQAPLARYGAGDLKALPVQQPAAEP